MPTRPSPAATPGSSVLWPPNQNGRPLLIAGPCVMEDQESLYKIASSLQLAAQAADFEFVFKASFDKANRSSLQAFRGPGIDAGLKQLSELSQRLELALLCDIHEAHQAAPAAEVVDVLQIPAFLCRQTDLLVAAGATGKPVNLKKGQFLAPWQLAAAVAKIRSGGSTKVITTERGTSFGHGDLVVDFRGLEELQNTGCPTLFDASHSAQQPGAHGDRSGGQRRWTPILARAAAAAGFDGLYLEVHPEPDRAHSDRDTQWPLHLVEPLLMQFRRHFEVQRQLPSIELEQIETAPG